MHMLLAFGFGLAIGLACSHALYRHLHVFIDDVKESVNTKFNTLENKYERVINIMTSWQNSPNTKGKVVK